MPDNRSAVGFVLEPNIALTGREKKESQAYLALSDRIKYFPFFWVKYILHSRSVIRVCMFTKKPKKPVLRSDFKTFCPCNLIDLI